MSPIAAPTPIAPSVSPRPAIRPDLPFIYAFAVGDTRTPVACIVPGEITRVDVSDGAHRPLDAPDWFAARTPAIPPVTGPLRVPGVAPGDMLDIEVLALEPRHEAPPVPLAVSVAVARGTCASGPMRVAIPPGAVVRVPAQRPGGSISLGPVFARRHDPGAEPWIRMAATVSIRVTVSPACGA